MTRQRVATGPSVSNTSERCQRRSLPHSSADMHTGSVRSLPSLLPNKNIAAMSGAGSRPKPCKYGYTCQKEKSLQLPQKTGRQKQTMAKPVGDDASTNSSRFENTHPHCFSDLPQFEKSLIWRCRQFAACYFYFFIFPWSSSFNIRLGDEGLCIFAAGTPHW